MRYIIFHIALFLPAIIFGTATAAAGQATNCSAAEDFRTWRVTILSNYQSAKPEEKKLAVDTARKFIEKADACKTNDEFVPWLKKKLPEWIVDAARATKISQAPVVSQYDAALAAKLGADERGMKMYVMCILKTGPKDAEIKGDERKVIFEGHFANIKRLADEGKLAVAGPFGKNDKSYRGLYIFNVPTIEEAEKLVVLDPAVKAGVFVPELTLWYGSASLMATPEIHKRLEKPKAN
jgi:uncharacterized protein YciI